MHILLVYSALIEACFFLLDVIGKFVGDFTNMSSTGWWHPSSPWLPSMLHAMAWSTRPLGQEWSRWSPVETSLPKPDNLCKKMRKHHLQTIQLFFQICFFVRWHGKEFGTKWPTWQLGVTKSCRRWQFQIFQLRSYPPAVEARLGSLCLVSWYSPVPQGIITVES